MHPLLCLVAPSLYFSVSSLVTTWAHCERCACLSPLEMFPLSNRERNVKMGAGKASPMHPSNPISGRKMHLCVCVHCCTEIWTDYYVSEIQSDPGSKDHLIFCTLSALDLDKIRLYTSSRCLCVASRSVKNSSFSL